MLEGFGEPPAFLCRHLVDGLFFVQIRRIDHDGDQAARQQVDERILERLALVCPEIAQDARIELFRRERRLQVELELDECFFIKRPRRFARKRQDDRPRHAEMREHHLAKEVLPLCAVDEEPAAHVAQGQTLHVLRPRLLRLERHERR